jgi:arabinose-5-phosphate isomerase
MTALPAANLVDQLRKLAYQTEQSLQSAIADLDLVQIARLAEATVQCPAVILMGVGKSGLIAEKISATLSSIGLRAFAVHPVEAQHGDLGRIQPGDLVLLLSKSGESDEMLAVLPSLKRRGVQIWAVTGSLQSRLARLATGAVVLPASRELDPHNIIPTTSTLLQLLIGDLLAMAVLDLKGTSLEEFHLNHPAGRIGRRLQLRVSDLMMPQEKTPRCSPSQSILDLLEPLSAGCSGCLAVTGPDHELLGLFTDGDLRRALERAGPQALQSPVQLWATASPRCISPETLAAEALRLMESNPSQPISVMPVVVEQKLVGLLRLHDLLQAGI